MSLETLKNKYLPSSSDMDVDHIHSGCSASFITKTSCARKRIDFRHVKLMDNKSSKLISDDPGANVNRLTLWGANSMVVQHRILIFDRFSTRLIFRGKPMGFAVWEPL